MAEEFKKGDTVRLKSGGPVMTVHAMGEYDFVKDGVMCTWFDGKNRKTDLFDRETLQRADPPSASISVVRG